MRQDVVFSRIRRRPITVFGTPLSEPTPAFAEVWKNKVVACICTMINDCKLKTNNSTRWARDEVVRTKSFLKKMDRLQKFCSQSHGKGVCPDYAADILPVLTYVKERAVDDLGPAQALINLTQRQQGRISTPIYLAWTIYGILQSVNKGKIKLSDAKAFLRLGGELEEWSCCVFKDRSQEILRHVPMLGVHKAPIRTLRQHVLRIIVATEFNGPTTGRTFIPSSVRNDISKRAITYLWDERLEPPQGKITGKIRMGSYRYKVISDWISTMKQKKIAGGVPPCTK